jgi:peroxiredoxin
MAYWGMAMANIKNEKRAKEFAKEAAKRRDQASPREQRYIDAWATFYDDSKRDDKTRRSDLVKALEDLIYDFPEDLEAKALLVFQLWDNKQHNQPLPSRLVVEALAQQVLAKSPMHPGVHHYLIHLWNYGNGDKRALASAARCGQSAPGIAHMWHMSGHTFSELKRYPDAVWQQEASARVDHAAMAATRIMPEQIHNYAHNNDWLVKNYGYIGRVQDALDLAKNLIELPRLGPGKQSAWRMGRDRLIEVAIHFELWKTLTDLEATPYLAADEDASRETARLRALGVAWFMQGETTRGQAKLEAIKQRHEKLKAERIAAADKAEAAAKAEKKSEDEVAKAMAAAMRGFSTRITELENAAADVRLARALAANDHEEARRQLALAKDLLSVRLARIHTLLGDFQKAEELARDLIKADPGQVLPHALLADALWQAGKREAALKAFAALRERSAALDLEAPAFARLAPLAAEGKLPADWRAPATVAPDAGVRPDLATLGPLHWTPYEAPHFSLPDRNNEAFTLTSHRGKPVLVVFYLGAGCVHCIEQLNALAPVTEQFTKAGIEVVAVSTETPAGLKDTFAKAKDPAGFPFRIVSDHGLETFRLMRAFDDFEGQPLHGTFLIDAQGFVRWQNISHQPFTAMPWLVSEARRLLALPVGKPGVTAAK